MALPALHFLIDLPTLQNAGTCDRRFDGNADGFSRRFFFPPGGKRLDVGDEVCAVMVRQRPPGWHISVHEAPTDRLKHIVIGRQHTYGRRAALENRGCEIARLGIDPRSVFAVAVAFRTVTPDAVPAIGLLA